MTRPLLLLAGALLAAAGCASGGGSAPVASAVPDTAVAASAAAGAAGATGAPATARSTRNSTSNVLTREELEGAGSTNMLDVVQALRPRWLQNNRSGTIMGRGGNQGGTSASPAVAVYVDGQLFGDANSLRSIERSSVERVTYLTTTAAQQRYGSRVYAPVIDIRLRSGVP
jgi:hypothetical protein